MGSNQIESVGGLSGLLTNRNLDSRAGSVASNVIQTGNGQQQQQQASSIPRNRMADVDTQGERHDEAPEDYYISDLYNQLTQVIAAKPTEIEPIRIGNSILIYTLIINNILQIFSLKMMPKIQLVFLCYGLANGLTIQINMV